MGKFLSRLDIASAVHEHEVFNSKIKRGEIDPSTYVRSQYVVCGCGAPGCGFITRWMKTQPNVVDLTEENIRYQHWLYENTHGTY